MALIWVIAAIVCAVSPTAAVADGDEAFLVHSCWPVPGPEGDGLDWYTVSGIRFCESEGLPLGFGSEVPRGYERWWEYTTHSNTALIRDLVMDVRSGEFDNGIEYTVESCESNVCTQRSVLDRDNDGTWVVSGLHASTVRIRATCQAEVCVPQDTPPEPPPPGDDELTLYPSSLRASRFRLLIEDSTAPQMSVSGVGNGRALPNWLRPGITRLGVGAIDEGVGVSEVSARIDPVAGVGASPEVEWSVDRNCSAETGYAYPSPQLCPESIFNSGYMDLSDLADGRHLLHADAVDGMGNVAEHFVEEFGIDSTPPARIRDLRFTSPITRFGWTRDPLVSTAWSDPLAEPSDGGSPLKSVNFDVDPIGSPSRADPPAELARYLGSAETELLAEGSWRIAYWIADEAGNHSRESELQVGLDRDAPEPVQPDLIPWMSPSRLRDGYFASWQASQTSAALESGVCGYAVEVSADPNQTPPERFDVESPSSTYRLPEALAEGRHHLQVRSVSCAGVGAETTGSTPIDVDSSAPILNMTGLPEAEWSRRPLTVVAEAADARSGVKSITRSLDGTPETVVGRSAVFTVGDGVHEFEASAVDVAENESARIRRTLRVDSKPPRVAFEPRVPDAPGRIVATAEDLTSGVESAWIEIRPIGSTDEAWRSLPSSATGTGTTADPLRVVTDLSDALPDGGYELSTVAVDRAGNSTRARSVRLSDAPMNVEMPVRTRIDLTAEIAPVALVSARRGRGCSSGSARVRRKRCTSRRVFTRRAATQSLVDYPGRAALLVELATRDGKPVRDARLIVRETVKGQSEARERTIRTNGDGRVQMPIPPGPGRNYTVLYAGTETLAAARGIARLRVRSGVHFELSRRSIRVGESVRLSGRVLGHQWHPEGSVRVDFGFFRGDGYDQILDPVFTGESGRFSYPPWRPGEVGRPTTYLLRAHVERAYGWPYESGNSKPVPLTVFP